MDPKLQTTLEIQQQEEQLRWDHKFLLLAQYKMRERHCCVPIEHVECGEPLGKWLEFQLEAMLDGSMSTVHQQKLKQIGVLWADEEVLDKDEEDDEVWDNDNEAGIIAPNQCCEHASSSTSTVATLDKHTTASTATTIASNHASNSLNVGIKPEEIQRFSNEKALHDSINHALQKYRRICADGGAPQECLRIANTAKAAKTTLVNKNPSTTRQDLWDDNFRLLSEFKQQKGHCRVPRAGGQLANWVQAQRQRYKTGNYDPIRKQRLDCLGFVWDIARDHWEDMFDLLKQFKEREGHLNVPRNHIEEDKPLWLWIMRQRRTERVLQNPVGTKRLRELGVKFGKRFQFREKNT